MPLPPSITKPFSTLLHPIEFLHSQKSLLGWRMTYVLPVSNLINVWGSVPVMVAGIQNGHNGAVGAVTYIRSVGVRTADVCALHDTFLRCSSCSPRWICLAQIIPFPCSFLTVMSVCLNCSPIPGTLAVHCIP